MKMKKLATLLSPMTNDGSPEGIADKGAGFAQYASPKKRSGAATDVGATDDQDDGFAKKGNRSANIGKEDGFALNSQVTKIANEKAGYNDHARIRRFRSPAGSIPAKSVKLVLEKNSTQSGQHIPPECAQRVLEKSGQGISTQSAQRIPAHSEQRFTNQKSKKTIPERTGQHKSTQSGKVPERVPEKIRAQSAERVLEKFGQCNSTQLEQPIFARPKTIQAKMRRFGSPAGSIPTQLEQPISARPETIQEIFFEKFGSPARNRPAISQQHSPIQSGQHTSHSGPSTPNQSQQSQQLTA